MLIGFLVLTPFPRVSVKQLGKGEHSGWGPEVTLVSKTPKSQHGLPGKVGAQGS